MTQPNKQKFAWSLWIPVILAFLFVSAAWFTIIKIAQANPTETVELDTAAPTK
jgi:large-conductance mechanosensitive channel